MNEKPLVSVIIVNYNGRPLLEQCLSSLMKIDYPKFEIILVDNNSTDDSLEFVKNNFSSVIIIKLDKNYGFAYPNNVGAKNAKGDFLLFLNNDTIVDPQFMTELVKVMQKDDKIAICQSLLLKPDGAVDSAGDFVDKYGRAFNSKKIPNYTSPILSARGACMLVKKEVFYELGKFDEKFFVSFEDIDIGWRAWIYGYKVVIVPKSVVYHYGGGTISTMSKEIQFHGAKNTLTLRITNLELSFLVKGIFVLAVTTFIQRLTGRKVLAEPELSPQLPPIVTIIKAIWWVLRNSRYVLNKRKFIQSTRILSTKDLIKLNLIKKI